MDQSNQRISCFWSLARECLADSEAHLRSAAALLELAACDYGGIADVQQAELARALADLVSAADKVDAKLLGLAASRLPSDGQAASGRD